MVGLHLGAVVVVAPCRGMARSVTHRPYCVCAYDADVREAPVWNSEKEGFVGMFTATDIISLMRYYHAAGKPQDTFVEHTIHSWRGTVGSEQMAPACQ